MLERGGGARSGFLSCGTDRTKREGDDGSRFLFQPLQREESTAIASFQSRSDNP